MGTLNHGEIDFTRVFSLDSLITRVPRVTERTSSGRRTNYDRNGKEEKDRGGFYLWNRVETIY